MRAGSLARPIWSMMRPLRGMRRCMKKAIGDNMIPKEWGFEKGLELVKQAGFDGIELWLGDVPWFQMGTADSDVRELRRKVENAGLVVSNVSTGLHWASPLSARDPKVRAQAVRIVERELETAGASIARIHIKDVMTKRGRCGDQSVYTNLFLGDNNWPAIRGAMTKVGYDGWLVPEMEARYRYAPDQQFYDPAPAMGRLISGRF